MNWPCQIANAVVDFCLATERKSCDQQFWYHETLATYFIKRRNIDVADCQDWEHYPRHINHSSTTVKS